MEKSQELREMGEEIRKENERAINETSFEVHQVMRWIRKLARFAQNAEEALSQLDKRIHKRNIFHTDIPYRLSQIAKALEEKERAEQ